MHVDCNRAALFIASFLIVISNRLREVAAVQSPASIAEAHVTGGPRNVAKSLGFDENEFRQMHRAHRVVHMDCDRHGDCSPKFQHHSFVETKASADDLDVAQAASQDVSDVAQVVSDEGRMAKVSEAPFHNSSFPSYCAACLGAQGCQTSEGCLPMLSKPACELRGGTHCTVLGLTAYPQDRGVSAALGAPFRPAWKPEALRDRVVCRKLIRCKHYTFGSFGASNRERHISKQGGYQPSVFGGNYGGTSPIGSLLQTGENFKPKWMHLIEDLTPSEVRVQDRPVAPMVSEGHCLNWIFNRKRNLRGRHLTEMNDCNYINDNHQLWFFTPGQDKISADAHFGFIETYADRVSKGHQRLCLDWGSLTGGRTYLMKCHTMWPATKNQLWRKVSSTVRPAFHPTLCLGWRFDETVGDPFGKKPYVSTCNESDPSQTWSQYKEEGGQPLEFLNDFQYGCGDKNEWGSGQFLLNGGEQECPVDDESLCNEKGFTCLAYKDMGWCHAGHVTAKGEANIGRLNNYPEYACCDCGGGLFQCEGSLFTDWRSSEDKTCLDYFENGWCIDGRVTPLGRSFAGPAYNSPELNCCICSRNNKVTEKKSMWHKRVKQLWATSINEGPASLTSHFLPGMPFQRFRSPMPEKFKGWECGGICYGDPWRFNTCHKVEERLNMLRKFRPSIPKCRCDCSGEYVPTYEEEEIEQRTVQVAHNRAQKHLRDARMTAKRAQKQLSIAVPNMQVAKTEDEMEKWMASAREAKKLFAKAKRDILQATNRVAFTKREVNMVKYGLPYVPEDITGASSIMFNRLYISAKKAFNKAKRDVHKAQKDSTESAAHASEGGLAQWVHQQSLVKLHEARIQRVKARAAELKAKKLQVKMWLLENKLGAVANDGGEPWNSFSFTLVAKNRSCDHGYQLHYGHGDIDSCQKVCINNEKCKSYTFYKNGDICATSTSTCERKAKPEHHGLALSYVKKTFTRISPNLECAGKYYRHTSDTYADCEQACADDVNCNAYSFSPTHSTCMACRLSSSSCDARMPTSCQGGGEVDTFVKEIDTDRPLAVVDFI